MQYTQNIDSLHCHRTLALTGEETHESYKRWRQKRYQIFFPKTELRLRLGVGEAGGVLVDVAQAAEGPPKNAEFIVPTNWTSMVMTT